MLNSQLFAKCGYLWPSSFLSSLPLSTSHRRIVLSYDPLTSCRGFVGLKWTQLTPSLPLSQMSALLLTALRLSPAEGETPLSGGKRERYLWPFSVALHVPDATSHILRVLSLDPDTMVSPLGENLHAQTISLPFLKCHGTHL